MSFGRKNGSALIIYFAPKYTWYIDYVTPLILYAKKKLIPAYY